MRARATPIFVAVLGLAALLLAGCGGRDARVPKYPLSACRRVDLLPEGGGAPIVGAEDVKIDLPRHRLLISAYNRLAAERAAARKAVKIPEGGVYAVDLGALAQGATAPAKRLLRAGDFPGGLRPQGLDVDAAGRIAFINRAYLRKKSGWALAPELVVADEGGKVVARAPARCSSNAVTFGPPIVVSFDHAMCGWRSAVEDVRDAAESGLADAGGVEHFGHAQFANGVVALGGGRLALAATRSRAILILSPDEVGRYQDVTRIGVAGGPDNISKNASGALVAALHTNLFRLALQRKLGFGRASSRVVEIDPDSGQSQLLFDDPQAKIFSAATGAVEIGEMLVAGSAVDQGLLICEAGQS